MITIDLGVIETYNPDTFSFDTEECGIVQFEYSLIALYNWEAKWKKPFFRGGLNREELVDFYCKMALTPIKKEFMTDDVMKLLADYIADTQTATTFSSPKESSNRQNDDNPFGRGKVYTAEELYALMFIAGVSIEFENRNMNRLFTTLRIISMHNKQPEKMDKQDIYKQNAELNKARRAAMKSKG